MPARALFASATALGYFFYYVVRFRRAVVETRVARAFPHAALAEQRRLARDSYVHAGLTLLWFLRLPTLDRARVVEDLVDVSDAAALNDLTTQIRAAKRHALVLTGHIGMWELLPAALASPLCEQWVVYRPLHHATLDREVASLRHAPQRHLVPDKHCFALLHEALWTPAARTQVVGLVADHRASKPHARARVTFLDQPTHLPTGAARLLLEAPSGSRRADRPTLWFSALLHNRAFYTSSSGASSARVKPFKLVLRQIPAPVDGQDAPAARCMDVAAITQSYAHMLDALVRAQPEQYLWLHDLWRDTAAPATCAS